MIIIKINIIIAKGITKDNILIIKAISNILKVINLKKYLIEYKIENPYEKYNKIFIELRLSYWDNKTIQIFLVKIKKKWINDMIENIKFKSLKTDNN